MNFTMPLFSIAAPEIFLLCMTAGLLLVDVFLPVKKRVWTYYLTQLTLAITFYIVVYQYRLYPEAIITFSGNYILDDMGAVLKMFICVVTFFVFAYSRGYLKRNRMPMGDYYILGLLAVLGMLIMCSGYTLLTLYLGLELLSLPLYAMVAMQKNSSDAAEAAMKYFVMGAMASGILLYGISLIYGATGSIAITEISRVLLDPSHNHMVVVLGLIFILTGLIFKFGAVPFHMWVPDVYQGAPTSMTMFIASAPKIAAFGMLIRILVEALPSVTTQWQQVLTVVAILSMFSGNLFAIAQTNLKRMLAYSSIAHIGYMLLGVIAGPHSTEGYSAALFYIATYVVVASGAFAIITLLSSPDHEYDLLEDYRGLNARNPWLAFMMLLLMFSMAGIPPTVGFFAKLGLLEALVEAHLVWLAALALVFAIIGAYYYLRIVMLMYFEEPLKKDAHPIPIPRNMLVAISANGLAVLAMGLFPSNLIDLCRISFS